MGQIEFLYPVGCLTEAAPNHLILVEVLIPVTHAADVKSDLRLEPCQGGPDIVRDLDMNRGLDLEILQALAVAGTLEAGFQPGAVFRHAARYKSHRQPAIGDFRRQLYGRFPPARE